MKISFEQYLLNEKRFINKHNREDVEFLVKNGLIKEPKSKKQSFAKKIRTLKQANAKNLGYSDDEVLKHSLSDIAAKAESTGIQLVTNLPRRSYNESDWRKHETAVTAGLNELFQIGIFNVVDLTGNAVKIEDKTNEKFIAIEAGGAVDSDVRVQNQSNGKSFFVECKLNYDTAGYFKYGLTIQNDRLVYDHGKYLEGKDEAERERVNQLFTNDVDLTSFLTKVVHNGQLLKHWREFHRRALEVKDFILGNEEFRDFAVKVKFRDVWPDDFKKFAEVFDVYCDYYTTKYNALMKRLFQTFDSSSLNIAEYTVSDSSRQAAQKASGDWTSKNAAFQPLSSLRQTIEENGLAVHSQSKFDSLVHAILEIESKFTALLASPKLLKEHNVSTMKNLAAKDKTRAFYKMFLSTSGRKSKDGTYDLMAEDQLGNMVVCPVFQMTDGEMAKLITNFYVKKDRCAYIQIGGMVYQFDKTFNPLNIPDLPVFMEHLRDFEIWIGMSDGMDKINLHIRAKQPDDSSFGSSSLVSFRSQDKNFLPSVVSEIDVKKLASNGSKI